jgi:hypothetical protein
VSLRDVSVYAALSAVQGAAGRETQWNVRPLGQQGSGRMTEAWALELIPQPQATISMGPSGSKPVIPVAETGIRVFSLRDLTEPMPGDPPGVALTKSPEVVLTAVKAALDLSGDKGEPPEMKFHEDSGLLIVHGTNDQVGAVMQTLEQMRQDVNRRREAAKLNVRPRADVDALRSEFRKAQVMQTQAGRDVERAVKALERGVEMVKAGQMSQGEIADLEAKRDEAQARVQLASIELERVQNALKAAEDQGRRDLGDSVAAVRARLRQLDDAEARLREQIQDGKRKGLGDDNAEMKKMAMGLEAIRDQRAQVQQFLEDMDGAGEGAAGAGGKSVVTFDLPPMDGKARDQLISSIRALEAAAPGKLHIQSVQGDSKLVVEAEAGMQGIIRGMIQEVAGGRGEPGKPDQPKPRGR